MAQRRGQPVRRARAARRSLRLPHIAPGMLKLAAFVAVFLVLLGGFLGMRAWLGNPENLRIEKVDIQGQLKYIKEADLRALIDKYTQTNLYLLDMQGLETALEAQPWIREASLRASWPRSLVVDVEEQRPVAFWGEDRLMNQFGELFAARLPSMLGTFPLLYSPRDNGREMGERFLRVSDWLKGLPLEIEALTEDSDGGWKMKLRNGPQVIIGHRDQERRIQRFRVGCRQELCAKLGNIKQVDLRYTNGFAVEWRQSPVSALDKAGGSSRS